ncbi:uncharacterized protein LOC128733519, partial [Sabethes cyaneus]|uniref:uncharacterized protein LOC128733519 n=1 Tax=Sabethes cyaneus TaxID=53552 RepID=UPI00237E750C
LFLQILLLVNIFCLAKFVKSYGVTEHRVDYIRTVDGHEYDYHYHDGTAPRFEKSKLLYLQQQHQRQQELLLGKRPYKQPSSNKYFGAGFEQLLTHRKFTPAGTPSTYSSFKQQNSIPIFESHEKVGIRTYPNHAEDDSSDYDDHNDRRRPAHSSLTKNFIHHSSGSNRRPAVHQYNRFESPPSESVSETESESQEYIKAPAASAKPFTSHSSSAGGINNNFPLNIPNVYYIPSGYTYFNSHTSPPKDKLAQILYLSPTPAPTTRRPYVAPSLTSTTPYNKFFTQKRPTKVPRRPYIAPILTTTRRPYVAPSVTKPTPVSRGTTAKPAQSGSQNPKHQQLFNGASRFRYTTSKPVQTTSEKSKPSDKYEPEFDIDIRIDLSPDSS